MGDTILKDTSSSVVLSPFGTAFPSFLKNFLDHIERAKKDSDPRKVFFVAVETLAIANICQAFVCHENVYVFGDWNHGILGMFKEIFPDVLIEIKSAPFHEESFFRAYSAVQQLKTHSPVYRLISETEKWNDTIMAELGCSSAIMNYLNSTCRCPFLAGSVDAPVLLPMVTGEKRRPVSQSALRLLHAGKRTQAALIEETTSAQVYDASVPMIFAAALSNAENLDDFLNILKQMRDTKEAASFRLWAARLDNLSSADEFSKEILGISNLAEGLSKGIGHKAKTSVSIGASFVVGAKVGKDICLPEFTKVFGETVTRSRHLTWFRHLWADCDSILDLTSHYERVLNAEGLRLDSFIRDIVLHG